MTNIHLKTRLQGLKENIRRIPDAELIKLKEMVNKEYDRRFQAEDTGRKVTGV